MSKNNEKKVDKKIELLASFADYILGNKKADFSSALIAKVGKDKVLLFNSEGDKKYKIMISESTVSEYDEIAEVTKDDENVEFDEDINQGIDSEAVD